jgi:hypothetical protein
MRSTPVGRPFDPSLDHPSCLCIFDRIAGKPVEQVPLSEDEFICALHHGIQGSGAAEFVAQAIREKLAAAPERMARPTVSDAQLASMFGAIDNLEREFDKYMVLVDALLDRLNEWAPDTSLWPQATRIMSGLCDLAIELDQTARSKYSEVLARWRAISPGLSPRMAKQLDNAATAQAEGRAS